MIIKHSELLRDWPMRKLKKSDGWVLAKPLDYKTIQSRLRELWLVLTGKGDVFVWDLEEE